MLMISNTVTIVLSLCIPQVHGKALAMRLVNNLKDELYRKVYDRANHVFWSNRMAIDPDNSEWGDMMWEIDDKYMREVDKAGAVRADHQIQALWEELMQLYREEIERLAYENEPRGSKEKMIRLLNKCKRKKEAEYFEQPEEEPPEDERDDVCIDCKVMEGQIDKLAKDLEELKTKYASASAAASAAAASAPDGRGGGRAAGRGTGRALLQEVQEAPNHIGLLSLIAIQTMVLTAFVMWHPRSAITHEKPLLVA
eukprot:gnl/MRDRNA2_/MRDRNA2_150648_c0_seq1.p1 gnl/MRDRNA2_/MRDRNA2_150648_c0~~gnl/MRDRNA2_/MRDRNA2_150648_c0_seq1.p1  ORF type:complete len:254 (-),score=53.66 gnl/MRDRNA2_/MRDRNA2_150648_c0_seq1:97-858(-)